MAIQPEGILRVQQSMMEDNNSINTPTKGNSGIMDSPGLEGSFQQVLADNLGHYVQIDFLVGVQTLVRRSGIIYAVGRSFVVLYDETNRNFVMCDVFSAKFVAFFATRPAPGVLPNNPMGIMEVDAQGNLWPVEHMEAPNSPPADRSLKTRCSRRRPRPQSWPAGMPPSGRPSRDSSPGWSPHRRSAPGRRHRPGLGHPHRSGPQRPAPDGPPGPEQPILTRRSTAKARPPHLWRPRFLSKLLCRKHKLYQGHVKQGPRKNGDQIVFRLPLQQRHRAPRQ